MAKQTPGRTSKRPTKQTGKHSAKLPTKHSKKRKPTELELLILKVLWRMDAADLPLAVRDIRGKLAESGRPLAHTSVITTLNIMVEKDFLKRIKRKNAFYFSPKLKQETVESRVIGDILNRVFDGSAQSLMLALLDRSEIDSDDIAEIRKMINRKSRQKPE